VVLSLITDEPPVRSRSQATTGFLEGDVVQLRSGGPKMTVDGLCDQAGQVQAKCSWFNGAIRMSDLFELHSLRNLEDAVPAGVTVSRMLDLDP